MSAGTAPRRAIAAPTRTPCCGPTRSGSRAGSTRGAMSTCTSTTTAGAPQCVTRSASAPSSGARVVTFTKEEKLFPRPAQSVIVAPAMKSVSQRLPAALMIGILSVAGCGSGRVVLPFTLDSSTLAVPDTTRDFGTTESAIRGISAILVRDLALPLPYTFTAYVYSDRHGFERGLIDDANVAPVRAAELSEFAVGIGKRRQLLLNDESGTARGREWY